jgi:hypothetical protein
MKLAEGHTGATCVLRIDVEDFFPTIGRSQAAAALRNQVGLSRQVATIVAKLATRHDDDGSTFLPQGSPLSSTIANLVLDPFDDELERRCLAHGCSSGRFVDDVFVSGANPRNLISFVISRLGRRGFRISRGKLLIMGKGGAQFGVGLKLNWQRSPTREFREECSRLLHGAERAESQRDKQEILKTLEGKLSYAERCQGTFARRLRNRMTRVRQGPTRRQDS